MRSDLKQRPESIRSNVDLGAASIRQSFLRRTLETAWVSIEAMPLTLRASLGLTLRASLGLPLKRIRPDSFRFIEDFSVDKRLILSLTRSEDRREFMEKQLSMENLTFDFFDAVDMNG